MSVAAQRHPGSPADDVPMPMPMHQLRRRMLQLAAAIVLVLAIVTLVPGLASVRARLATGSPAWLTLAATLEVLSCLAYVVAFRAAFCARMSWRMSWKIGMSELGAASVLPAGGAGGLAFGAWALRRSGMARQRIARRTVAFFLITSAVNVAAVILAGTGVAVGILAGPHALVLSVGPVVLAMAAVLGTLAAPRLTASLIDSWSSEARAKPLRTVARVLDAMGDGVGEALALLRSGDLMLLAGAVGYLVFDLAVLAVCFRAFGVAAPPIAAVALAYLLGQLGALIPVPGGIGGADAGLIGALVLYGTSSATATVAVLAYRALLLVIPAVLGGSAFIQLKRALRDEAAVRIPCADDLPVASGVVS